MARSDLNDELLRRRRDVQQGGGPEAIERQHAKGKRTARERIDALIGDLESGDPQRIERARLWRQPGGYGVSLPEVDELVDIALATPGVMGAGLVGAGMGGCIVAVVESQQARSLIRSLVQQYYRPRGFPPKAEVITPVGGLHTFCL